ncbi:SBF-like CPA transporter family-domain-containing protein [Polychytrium aggregatum]|uniref:SBF-like CPA transporter family-domain-containing protein n=1 Tax=Polychytrium aggregatum TaxID=110093 RepID=UPI0022FED31C|nr:SBF-like CPA transporter family-domain-containing protein [Polychytrium aggregatum]KAI9199394.1 SBF-like CPA transporter family-domain-containing protein [Polychytrium aggregatum]
MTTHPSATQESTSVPESAEASADSLAPLAGSPPTPKIEEQPEPKPTLLQKIKAVLIKQWFLVGLALVIGLAAAYPPLGKKNGIIHAEITVKYVAVALIFVLSGLSMKTSVLAKSFLQWKIHLAVQITSFVITPAIGYGVAKLLGLASFNADLVNGKAGGNEPAALTNAVIGNILGVFISPSLILWLVGSSAGGGSDAGSYTSVLRDLMITVIAPLIVGQLFQYFTPGAVAWLGKRINFAYLNSSLLLLLVWNVFCDTFSENIGSGVNAGSIVAIGVLDISLFILFNLITFLISNIKALGFTRQDGVAIMMCGATKTVALGIPMINIIYGNAPNVGILSTPLLLYHAEQLIGGAVLVTLLGKWVARAKQAEQQASTTV